MVRPRRANGFLRESILRALHNGRPLRAVDIQESVGRKGLRVPSSLIFRDLGKLVEQGKVRRVYLARSYALATPAPSAALYCSVCGGLTQVACDRAFLRAAQLAAQARFSPSHAIIELSGICSACQARTASKDTGPVTQ